MHVKRGLAASVLATAFVLFTRDAPAQPDPSRAEEDKGGRTQATPPSGAASPTAPGAAGTAEAPVEGPPQATPLPPVPPGPDGTSPTRPMPDYDGRGTPRTTAGDVLLWIPRILFSPLYLVSEYLIRRPLGWFITTAEQKQWPAAISNFFTFGPDKKAGIVPTVFLDFGFRPSIGIYAFWNDLLGEGNHLRLHASTFGADWLQGALADRFPIGRDATLDLRFEALTRPDQVFHGMGPRTLQSDRSRYGIDRIQARPVFELNWWKGSRVTTEGGLRYVHFREDACCGELSLNDRLRAGTFEAPPAYFTGYTAAYQRGELTIDTRDARPAKQDGFRLELEAEMGSNVREARSNWVRYGGSIGGFVDLHNNRTVSLSVTTLFVDPISSGAVIPFTEQIVLGGSGPMRGYLYGRLVDRSAAIATLKYRWPIWVFLDGTMQFAAGNVFGAHLRDFETKLLRFSGALGVESIGSPDHTFEFLVGFGTETIDHGANVNSLRIVFGTNRGF